MSTQTKYRYANSFFITTVLYLIASFFLFYVFADTLIIEEKKQEIKTISLQHVALVEEQKIVQQEPTPIEPEPEIKPEPIVEPLVEKQKPIKKKIKKPKEHVKKHSKKPIEKIVEKQIEPMPTPIQNTPVERIVEKIETIPTVSKTVLSDNEKENIEAEYLSKIRYKIEKNKNYPKIAKRLNHTGKVHVTFTITKDGRIKDFRLQKSASFDSLNNAALEIFQAIVSFEPIPEKLNKEKWEITIPIVYQIARG